MALVVSEETGKISVAAHGEIQHGVPIEYVEEKLTAHTTAPLTPPATENSTLELRRS
jgi:hypothetical protein